jgi:hypothetical protein
MRSFRGRDPASRRTRHFAVRSFALNMALAFGFAASALPAAAQVVPTCSSCVLGLYDEPQLEHAFGDIVPFVTKDIYLGVQFAPPETGLTGIEFSISGLQSGGNPLLTNLESVTTPPAAIILGNPFAPADTSATSAGTGGMNVAWSECHAGSQALLRLRLLALGPIANHVLRVMHRFPPTNPLYGRTNPIVVRCEANNSFVAIRVTGAEYVLNGVVATEGATWSGMKQLFR